MRNFAFSTFIFLVLAVCLSFMSNNAHADDGALDGKTYSVMIKEMGKDGDGTKDDLIFKDGTLLSTECVKYGFEASPYEFREMDDAIMFISSSTSEKEGENQWEGKVEGDKIKGTFLWIKMGQDPVMYKYEGSLKK